MAKLAEFIFQADEAVANWVAPRLPEPIDSFGDPYFYRAIGLSGGGKMLAGVVYTRCLIGPDGPHSVEMHIAADSPKWASRTALKVFFGYAFQNLGATRVTALTTAENTRCRRMLERLGFVLEGTMRAAYPSGSDALIYGLLGRECRWC